METVSISGGVKGVLRAPHSRSSFFTFLFCFVFFLTLAPVCLAQTELGSEDDLTIMGTNGSALDPDVEIKGFTVFGSTQAAYTGAVIGNGNVVVNGVLAVSSGAYFVGNSTFTGAGRIFINDGSAGQILSKNSGGWLDWINSSAIGDNLGSHIATQNLTMTGYNVADARYITASSAALSGQLIVYGTSTLAGNAFSVGGSTLVATNGTVGIRTAAPGAALDVVSTGTASNVYAQIWRDSGGVVKASMTATGVLYATLPPGTGDNLGSHIATQNLTMTGYNVADARYITASSAALSDQLIVYGTSTLKDTGITGTLGASGDTILAAKLHVGTNATFVSSVTAKSDLGVSGKMSITTMSVTGPSTFTASMYMTGVASFTDVANIYITGGNNNEVLAKNGSTGPLKWTAVAALGDNLGNHTATQNLTMTGYNVADARYITASSAALSGQLIVYGTSTLAGNAFSVGGSTLVATNGTVGIRTAAPQAALDIVSTGTASNIYAQIWRDGSGIVKASMTSQGVMFVTLPPGSGDNLGNHTATEVLKLGVYGVNTSSNITAARYQIAGSTVLSILPGTGSLGVGVGAGRISTGNNNLFFGTEAGFSNAAGEKNSYLGYQAGYTTTGDNNSYLGYQAGYLTTTGGYNSFFGSQAGMSNTAGNFNSLTGYAAGYSNTTGTKNSQLGYQAGFYAQTGSANAIFGAEAGYGATGNSFSSSTLMGYQAGYGLASGSDNIFVGFKAGYNVTTGTGNIIIGYNQNAPTAAANNFLNIGGVIYGSLGAGGGNVGIGVSPTASKLAVGGNTQLEFDTSVAGKVVMKVGGVAVAEMLP